MTRHERRIVAQLLEATAGLEAEEALVRLLAIGALDMRRCGQLVLRDEVERLVRRGAGRCEAMEEVAAECHCSYGKVRQAVYYKPKSGSVR